MMLWGLISISLAAILALVLWNLVREKQLWQGTLIPNCLLTRFPIVFIPGPRSIFFFRKYYFKLPSFLAEHGYEVFELHLPWKTQRAFALDQTLSAFQKKKRQIHIVL